MLIILIAAMLRFCNISGMSLMNDELSALARTHYTTFSELINKGVAFEGHPPGVQIFLTYWTRVLGDSVFVVRFPFVLCGIVSVFLTYKTGSLWFSKSTGLFAAASLAILEFPLLYSQLARMYSPGLFTTLLFALCWTKLFMLPHGSVSFQKRIYLKILYVVAGAASLYIHYFAFFLTGLICFTGLFLISKEQLKSYALLNLFILILFLPMLKLFFTQLALGGLAWLPKPDSGTFFQFFKNFFNDSSLYLIFIGVFIITLAARRKQMSFSRFHFFSLVFFLVPFFTGYYYSVWRNPVLQLSGMLFSFPYVLLFLFSFMPAAFTGMQKIFLGAFIALLLFSTIIEKKYFRTYHFGEFKELADLTYTFNNQLGADNITHVFSVQNPQYLQYYFDKKNMQQRSVLSNTADDSTCAQLMQVVAGARTSYFIYAFSNMQSPPQIFPIIQWAYPYTVFKKDMFNSGFYVFSRDNNGAYDTLQNIYEFTHDFEKVRLKNDSAFITSWQYCSPAHAADITGAEYGPAFEKKLNEINYRSGTCVNASVQAWVDDKIHDAFLVITVTQGDSVWKWVAANMHYWVKNPHAWQPVLVSAELPPGLTGNEDVKVFVWNRGKKNLFIDDLKITITERADYYKKGILKN